MTHGPDAPARPTPPARRRRSALRVPPGPRGLAILLLTVVGAALAPAARATAQPVGPPLPESMRPPLSIELTYDPSVTDTYTGPVFVVFSAGGPPFLVPRPFDRSPIIRVDVTDWRPDDPLTIDASNATCAPMDFDEIQPGRYFLQAFMVLAPGSYKPGTPGNAGSATIATQADAFDSVPFRLRIDRLVRAPRLPDDGSNRIVTEVFRSDLLSDFHGTDVELGYTVVLPPGYFIESDRMYPTRFWIGAHGTDHHVGTRVLQPLEEFEGGNDIVTVLLKVTTRFGHPLYVDSASSGPWARALLEEVIPRLEREYRLDPRGRFLSGHAAGGWTALSLQLNHPEVFAGAWATAPWPTSFASWFGTDLYDVENAFVRSDGSPRRYGVWQDGRPTEPARITWHRERVVGAGGMFGSFEWAFSPPGPDGRPRPFFDPATGAVDREVVEHWSRYDLARLVERRGADLATAIGDDPIVITVGGRDGFRLAEPVQHLVDAMSAAGIAVEHDYLPEGGHADIATMPYQMAALKAMVDRFWDITGGEVPRVGDARPKPAGSGGGG